MGSSPDITRLGVAVTTRSVRMMLSLAFAFGWAFTISAQVTIFSENVGTPSGTTLVSAPYTGWQNGAPVSFTSTVNTDVRSTGSSSLYTGASGSGNVFLGTATSNFKDFLISGINTTGYNGITLSFGLIKSGTGSLSVLVSSDGVTYTALTITESTTWTLVTAVGAIPATANLRIKFEKNNGASYRIDDIRLTGTLPTGPTVNFSPTSSSAMENVGTAQTINMAISPATTAITTFTIVINGSSTATYTTDYTTAPAAAASIISVTVAAGAIAASFDVNLVDDAITEGDETIDFTITAATGGTFLGSNVTHQFTITDDDNTPTIEFTTLSISALESALPQTFTLSIIPAIHPTFNVTFTITNGPGAVYGTDYTTNPPAPTLTFMRTVPINQGTVTFTVDPLLDGIAEPTEWVRFTISSVPVGYAIGTNDNATLYIGDIDSPPALFAPGDLAIVGVNANDNDCDGGDPGEFDYVSFFCFQEITWGTELILTDNGFGRCTPGLWGNTEGTVRMKRTGPAIPAGQVVTFKINGVSGIGNVVSVAPDAGWSCTSIGVSGTAIALNVNGDQLFFLQGGTWSPGTAGNHNATYTGTLLYAFTSNPTNPWTASCTGTSEDNKRSNLPPGVECFSMAPTGASDFNKYTGPSTAATQRDWIIRIENAVNWNSYPGCGLYNSSGYNWLTAPILPITPGAMVNGVWRGAINTDWFNCKNWDDARIPDATSNVVIDQNSTSNCQVGLASGVSPGGTAVCSSLLLTSNGTGHLLMVEANSTLNITNDLTVQRTAGTGAQTVYVKDNATITGRNLYLRSVNTAVDEAVYYSGFLNSVSRFSGNVTIEPGGYLNLNSPIAANFGTVYIGGNYWNQRTEAAFEELYSQVVFDGSGPQSITTNSFEELFYNLRVNKPSGTLTLNDPVGVRGTLDLLNGQVLSTTADLLTMKYGSAVTGVNTNSFVNGPVQKIGNTAFTFPTGKNNHYRPASLSDISGGPAAAFTAEYFNASPTVTLGATGLNHDASLHHVSACEHWRIDRSSGTPNATVTLSWLDPVSCGVTSLPDMRVGYWNGTLWTDAGGTLITGTNAAGTVSTAGAQSTYLQAANYWTLASLSNANPLPIELLSFTAQPNGSQVELKWSTASEKDNDHFTVERSMDAVDFTALLEVPGAGNSQNVIDYADTDPSPLDGLSYYRLRQTDIDGTTVVSEAVPVYFNGSKGRPLQVLYSNDGLYLLHDFAPGSTLEVMDLTGRVIGSTGITENGLVKVPLDGLAHGVYLLRMSDGARVEGTRVAF